MKDTSPNDANVAVKGVTFVWKFVKSRFKTHAAVINETNLPIQVVHATDPNSLALKHFTLQGSVCGGGVGFETRVNTQVSSVILLQPSQKHKWRCRGTNYVTALCEIEGEAKPRVLFESIPVTAGEKLPVTTTEGVNVRPARSTKTASQSRKPTPRSNCKWTPDDCRTLLERVPLTTRCFPKDRESEIAEELGRTESAVKDQWGKLKAEEERKKEEEEKKRAVAEEEQKRRAEAKKKIPCKYVVKGTPCPFGVRCNFMH
jgi:hypothetical protein